MIIDAPYNTISAARWFWVIAMPIGTPVRMASVTATTHDGHVFAGQPAR